MFTKWRKELNTETTSTVNPAYLIKPNTTDETFKIANPEKKTVRVTLKKIPNNKVTIKKVKVHAVTNNTELKKEIKLFRKYRHYKGGVYIPIHIVTHTETCEKMVVYVGGDSDTVWVRPLSMWFENVYIDVIGSAMAPRFTLLEGED